MNVISAILNLFGRQKMEYDKKPQMWESKTTTYINSFKPKKTSSQLADEHARRQTIIDQMKKELGVT
jgi:hypothetical protein